MLNFDTRTGPDFGSEAPTYPGNAAPQWYRDAKLGFFIHWGLYSVPAWATRHTGVPVEDAFTHHQYAEWYGNTVRITGSPTWQHHQDTFGTGTSYEDLADLWQLPDFDASAFVGDLVRAGARYIIPTTKHHEGFCLWDTATTRFNSLNRGPRRDLVAEFHHAARAAGVRFGVYFSGGLDWHVSDFPPIESEVDLFRYRRHDERFARYSTAQLEELIERFSPEILWNDIEWPDGGKGREEYALAAVLGRYFERVPTGVVNDRWGIPYRGFLTREYSHVEEVQSVPWESTRGLGRSFGYNQAESEDDSLSGAEVIRLLVDVVSKNGNLLLNVGPRADGSIPDLQRTAIDQLGAWMRQNGAAIYGTRPWIRSQEPVGAPVRYTTSAGRLHIHALDPATGLLPLPAEADAGRARWADGSPIELSDAAAVIPQALRGSPVAVLTAPLRS
ncbi:MAG: alpha-L-fucosidase [Propionicimonas sp.]